MNSIKGRISYNILPHIYWDFVLLQAIYVTDWDIITFTISSICCRLNPFNKAQ
jgi:hypothetical protein